MAGRWSSRRRTPTAGCCGPRQVRAGVPRVLDTLCDAVLNPDAGAPGSHARGAFDLTTAGGIGDALREFVGDPAGLADAEAAAFRRREAGRRRPRPRRR